MSSNNENDQAVVNVTFEVKIPNYILPGDEFHHRQGICIFCIRCPPDVAPGDNLKVKVPVVKTLWPGELPSFKIKIPEGVKEGMLFPVSIQGLPPFLARCRGIARRGMMTRVVPPNSDPEWSNALRERETAVVVSIISLAERRTWLHRDCTWNRASGEPDGINGADNYDCRKLIGEEMSERIKKLPALSSTFHGIDHYEWNDTTRTILAGVHDKTSHLSMLRGKEDTLVDSIFSFLASKWASKVTLTLPAFAIGHITSDGQQLLKFGEKIERNRTSRRLVLWDEIMRDKSGRLLQGLASNASIKIIDQFPEPKDLNVNMLPFVFGDLLSLPEKVRCYYNLIEQTPYPEEEVGKVGYLTVHESFVDASESQRRGGLHIEAPGSFTKDQSLFIPGREHSWGCGDFFSNDRLEGGIFMASTVADSCEVWDALVDKDAEGIVDRHGGCEHLRHLLGPGRKLKANELIWMTDCTPHEALPQKESGYRQFFRVVTSNVSHWFADHSTPNPLVPLPNDVVIVRGSKFAP